MSSGGDALSEHSLGEPTDAPPWDSFRPGAAIQVSGRKVCCRGLTGCAGRALDYRQERGARSSMRHINGLREFVMVTPLSCSKAIGLFKNLYLLQVLNVYLNSIVMHSMLCLFIVSFAGTSVFAGQVHLLTSISCFMYDSTKEHKLAELDFNDGYIVGYLNAKAVSTGDDYLKGVSTLAVITEIREQCKFRPSATIQEVAEIIAKKLGK
jgi:hypothetical protein